MNAAIGYNDSDLYGKNGEQFQNVFMPVFADAASMDLSASADIAEFVQKIRRILPRLEIAAFMARLSARDRIPFDREKIESLRKTFLGVRNNFLDNDKMEFTEKNVRKRLEFAVSQMAQAITLLDIYNNPEIRASFANSETDEKA